MMESKKEPKEVTSKQYTHQVEKEVQTDQQHSRPTDRVEGSKVKD